MQHAPSSASSAQPNPLRGTWVALGLLGILLLYSYWNSLILLGGHWQDKRYSHGWLVPVFAAVLLWMRWEEGLIQPFSKVSQSARWWGVALLVGGLSLRVVAARRGIEFLDFFSMLPSIAGVILLAGGWRFFLWAAPVVAFLGFMFPLPYTGERMVLVPLQKVASVGATYVLQTIGYGAVREGAMITIGETRMEVVEACSGLRMLTVFLSLTAAVAMILQRPAWERIVIFLSALPIALIANVFRITCTGLAHYHIGSSAGEWCHDHGEFLMMPPALLMLYLEIVILNNLFIEDERVRVTASPVGRTLGGREMPPKPA